MSHYQTWGLPLARKIGAIRAGKVYSSEQHRKRLHEVGFVLSPREQSIEIILDALRAFLAVFGHLDVPQSYEVPTGDTRFPSREPRHILLKESLLYYFHVPNIFVQGTYSLKLGMRLRNIRYRTDIAEYIPQFKSIGLDLTDSSYDERHWEHVYAALVHYRKIFGDINVSTRFVVPEDIRWPRTLHGLKLGYRVRNIKYRGDFIKDNPEYKNLLSELGFKWTSSRVNKRNAGRGHFYLPADD